MIIWIIHKISHKKFVQTFTQAFIIISFIYPIIGISSYLLFKNKDNNYVKKEEVLNFNLKQKPNIYYILVDAYAREDTLLETLSFDNSNFLNKLKNVGS